MTEALPAPLVPPEVTPREAAARRGHVRYSDGRPCVHGHICERFTRNAACVACQRIMSRAYRLRFRDLLDRGSIA